LLSPGFRVMKFYLIVAKGKHKGMPIEIKVDLFLIGSKKICQLHSNMEGVGEEHCALVTRERKVFLRDLDSGEATSLNGSVVPPGEEWPVHAGDMLEVGPLEFMIQFREKPLSQRDLEEWAAKCLDVSSERELFGDEEEDGFHQPTDASEAAAAIIDKLQAQRGLVMGRLRIGRDGSITAVRFNDTHMVEESEIALIKKELCEFLAHPNLRVLLDFKNVRRMSTAAINMLREFCIWLRPWGSNIAFCRVRADLQPMLVTMGLNIRVFPDKRTAMAAKW
jgi:anti-anti-sigma regulatory factor